MTRLSALTDRWQSILASVILVVFIVPRIGHVWRINLTAIAEIRFAATRLSYWSPDATLRNDMLFYYDIADCIVATYYDLRETPCPPLEDHMLPSGETDFFQYLRGWKMLSQGQTREALSLWRHVDESDLLTIQLGVSTYQAHNNVALALAYFELAQQINPHIDKRKQPMHSAKCRIYLWDKKEFPEAVHACKLAAQFENEAQILLGHAYVKSGQYSKAIEALSAFLLEQPQHAVALYWRARAYRKLGNLHAAERDYRAAIAGNQLVPAAYTELAHLLGSLGEICEAHDLLTKAEQSSNEQLRKRARNSLRRLGPMVCDQDPNQP